MFLPLVFKYVSIKDPVCGRNRAHLAKGKQCPLDQIRETYCHFSKKNPASIL